jgi:flagellar motility protein MotE (MotC chaperone)
MSIRRFMLAAFSFQLALGLLFLGTAPVSAAGGGDKKDDGHGGGDSGGGEEDPNALPEFDGPPPPLPWEIPRASENECSTEEIVVLRELRERSELLDLRAQSLDERERAIKDAERLLKTRLAAVEKVRTEVLEQITVEKTAIIEKVREEQAASRKLSEEKQDARLKRFEAEQAVVLAALARDQQLKDERLEELAGIVATMKPKAAAAMLAGMDESVALQVLLQIKPKSAGKILAAMPSGVSQTLGDKMTVHRDPRRLLGADLGKGLAGQEDPEIPSSPAAQPTATPADSASTNPTSN